MNILKRSCNDNFCARLSEKSKNQEIDFQTGYYNNTIGQGLTEYAHITWVACTCWIWIIE